MAETSAVYNKLVDYGIDAGVASELDRLHQSGMLTEGDLDERAMDAIKEFPADRALDVLAEFKQSNLEHVTNKSAFLCSIMKVNRQKTKTGGGAGGSEGSLSGQRRPGPDEAKIKEILDRTGYSLDVTTGQRKYGGPPPGWQGNPPGCGHEVFCGRIPKDVFEDELIPLFERCGNVWDLRLMMDPMTGYNRSFCFVTFFDKEGANEAVKQLNGHEIRPGKPLKVNISVANVRLFVGNIPKNKSKEEILEEFRKHTDGIVDVIIYNSPDDSKKKNRGFAFLEYDSHKSASMAKHRIGNGYTRVWGCDIIVDWADPQEEPDEETMSKVKVLYVRNLKSDVTEEQLRERFEQFGKVERVKKVKDYGFVHFEDREHALVAMEQLQGTKIGESEMQISLAKPPTENKQKEKRKQMHKMQFLRGGYDDSWLPSYPGPMVPPTMRGGGRFFRPPGPPMMPYRASDYDYHGSYNSGSYPGYDYYGGGYEHEDYGYYTGPPYGEPVGRGRGGARTGGGPAMSRSAPSGHGGFWQPPQAGPSWRPSWTGPRGGGGVGGPSAQWASGGPRR